MERQKIIWTDKQKFFGGKNYKFFSFIIIFFLLLFPFFVFTFYKLELIKHRTNIYNYMYINTIDNFAVLIVMPLAIIFILWIVLEKPISISVDGIIIPKLSILRRCIPKENILSIYIGKYSDIDKGKSDIIFAAMNLFAVFSRYPGRFRLTNRRLKEALVMRTDTIDNSYLTYLRDSNELINNFKKIGIHFSEESGVFRYKGAKEQIHKEKKLFTYLLTALIFIYVLLGASIIIVLYFTLKK